VKRLLIRFLSVVVACGYTVALGAAAQQSNPPLQPSHQTPAAPPDQTRPEQTRSDESDSGMATGKPRIAPGSLIPVQLTKTIDAKKVKTGDEIEAKVTQDLKAGNGDVVLPKDTKVMGHVTEAQIRNKEQKESEVGIAFDHAIMKNGGDVALPMSIQAIIAPPSSNAANSDASGSVSQAPSAQGTPGMPSPNGGGRSTGMGGGMQPQATGSPTTAGGITHRWANRSQNESAHHGKNPRRSRNFQSTVIGRGEPQERVDCELGEGQCEVGERHSDVAAGQSVDPGACSDGKRLSASFSGERKQVAVFCEMLAGITPTK